MADIALDQVTKRYADGTEAVRSLDLHIGHGEFAILVGPSGCGKTTVLRMIAGLEEITSGNLRIGGRVVNDLAPKAREVAMVFQSYALYPHMTVRQNIGFPLKLSRLPRAEASRRIDEVARILDLTEHLDRRPALLSGGQRQRVAMGRAMVREPSAFLMDEPLSNLDAKLRVQMRAEVAALHQRLGVTTVYVTHDQTEAMTLGQRVAVLRLGVLQQFGSPRELYDAPVNLFVAGFIGSPTMNFFPGSIADGHVRTPLGPLTLDVDASRRMVPANDMSRDVIVGIRPEDFEDANLVGDTTGFVFDAPIQIIESMGSETFAYFTHQGRQIDSAELREIEDDAGATPPQALTSGSRAIARLDRASMIEAGDTARLWVDTRRLYLFDAKTGFSLMAPAGRIDGGRRTAVASHRYR